MKKVVLKYTGIILLLVLSHNMGFAQEGFGTNTPHKSAVIEIKSEKRGLLIPRVQLTSTTVEAPVITPIAQSLLVYNENTTTGTNGVSPGYYYWDTNRWVRFAQQNDIQNISLSGDVTGGTGTTQVVAIQGTAISATSPVANQILKFDGTNWTPTAGNNITGTNITVTGGTGAALNDVSLKITPSNTGGHVLLTSNNTGEAEWFHPSVLMPTINNALNYNINTNEVQLGGPLTNPTTITTTATNTLKIAGLQTGTTSDNLVAVDTDGTLRQVTAAMPKFFYMPPIIFDTSTTGTGLTKNLYAEYVNQFGTPVVSSTGATTGIPTLPAAADLEYHITYYDTDVFENLSIDVNGVLTYDIKANATEASFMTIVFVVK